MKLKLQSRKFGFTHDFLKSSYSTVPPVSSSEFSKPFVKPGSAIKNRVNLLPGLLIIKVMKNPCFYGGFRALFTVVAYLGVPGFL